MKNCVQKKKRGFPNDMKLRTRETKVNREH